LQFLYKEIAYIVRLVEVAASVFVRACTVTFSQLFFYVLSICHHAVCPCKVVSRFYSEESFFTPFFSRQGDGKMKSSVYLSVCTKGIQADGILSEVPRTVSSHSIITVNISSCFQVELQVEAWFVVRSIQ